MDAKEIAHFAEQMKWGVCYDLSHALLYCNHKRQSLSDFTRTINDHISYLHVSDAAGTTQEGLQLGEGVIDYEHLFEILSKLNVGFVPEIWQGHLDKGHGFKKALRTIEGLMKKVSGESCSAHPPGQHVNCEFASLKVLN
jgi:N-acetylneuraminate synthase